MVTAPRPRFRLRDLADEANRRCVLLARDESGVVLAVTLVVFLTLFVMGGAVFAIGETVRLRIEVQNAADAAAYSAAVVQADTISRVAAINNAMAWTYVQMCRRQMDYVVGKWITKVVEEWRKEEKIRRQIYDQLTSGRGHPGPYVSRLMWLGDENHRHHVRLNRRKWVTIEYLESESQQWLGRRGQLVSDILKDHQAIRRMNEMEETLLGKTMPQRIDKVVRHVVRENIRSGPLDAMSPAGNAGVCYALVRAKNPLKECFELQDEEAKFLKGAKMESSDLGAGHDTWFLPKPSPFPWKGYREYTQWGNGSDCLLADWKSFLRGYWRSSRCKNPKCKLCAGTAYYSLFGPRTYYDHWEKGGIKGADVKDKYFKTETAKPQRCRIEFFDRPGALVVGVARRVYNPLQFFAPGRKKVGTFQAFTLPVDRRYLWGAAAARAGYKDRGSYNSTIDSYPIVNDDNDKAGWQNGGWASKTSMNLTVVDWDALLLPLHRAWSPRKAAWIKARGAGGGGDEPGQWKKETGAQILGYLWSQAKWKGLWGGSGGRLSSLAAGNAPPDRRTGKTGGGGTISFSKSMEPVILH